MRHARVLSRRPVFVRTVLTRVGASRRGGERGMATAEYAVGTLAAASFAGLLIKLLTSEEVRELLLRLVKAALEIAL